MRPLNEWQNLKLGHFEVGNLGQKLALFSAIIFSLLEGARATFKGLNERRDLKLLYCEKFSNKNLDVHLGGKGGQKGKTSL